MSVLTPVSFEQVYARLREIARHERRKGGASATLNTTALVHETYIELSTSGASELPRDFYAYAARAMRNLIIDEARRRMRVKRGGDVQRVDADTGDLAIPDRDLAEAVELNDALQHLAKENARAAEIVDLHYFAGLELNKIAELLGVSERTINRDWRAARAWLKLQLS
jgi:RNA polymerase sigma factor (TIGR02999 family)